MAAGPKQLAKDYIESIEEIKEKIETMQTGLEYAPGFNHIELDEYSIILSYLNIIEKNTNDLYNYLNENIAGKYPDKTAEEISR